MARLFSKKASRRERFSCWVRTELRGKSSTRPKETCCRCATAGAARQDQAADADQDPSQNLIPAWVQDYALFLLDVDGQIVAWYAGAERIYGYKSDEAVGQHVSLLYPDEDNSAPGWTKN